MANSCVSFRAMETMNKQNVFSATSKRISAIFFDMDNTLIQTRKADLKACNKVITKTHVKVHRNRDKRNENIFSFPSSSPRRICRHSSHHLILNVFMPSRVEWFRVVSHFF